MQICTTPVPNLGSTDSSPIIVTSTVHQWHSDFSTDIFRIAFVFGVNFNGDAGRNEFGTRSRNEQVFVAAGDLMFLM